MLKREPYQRLHILLADLDQIDARYRAADSEVSTIQRLREPLALAKIAASAYCDVRQEWHVVPEVGTQHVPVESVVKCSDLVATLLGHEEDVAASPDTVGKSLGTAEHERDRSAVHQEC